MIRCKHTKVTIIRGLLLAGLLLWIGSSRLCAQNSGTPARHRGPQKGLRPPSHEKAPGLYLLADGKRDSVVLRWVPSTDILWKMGNKYGYIVERFTVIRNGKVVPGGNKQAKLLTSEPLRPWSKQAMSKLVDKDEYAGVVEEAMYESDFNIKMKSESPKEIMAQVEQSQNRLGFALLVCDFSPLVARAAALRLVDRRPLAGERYIYRVKIALPDSLRQTITYQPGVTMLGPEEAFLRPSIQDLKAQFGNREVALSWNQEMLHGVYTAYNIERSVSGGPFVRVNQHPFLQMTTSKGSDKYAYYVDSLTENYLPYSYRITGITPFGDLGGWSDTVRGEGLSRLEYRPFFDSIFLSGSGNSAVIRWTLPDSIRRQLAGIYIARAPKNQGPYTDINKDPYSPEQREAVDPLVTGNSNYYRLRLVQKDGRQISSLPYYLPKADSIPPAIPVGLQGVSDRRGIARIHWRPDTEKDLKGYRLFRSQVEKGEYVEITKGPITDTAFTDTLNLSFTNPFVYYRVIALDHYYNSSDYSAPLSVRRPDTIPPMPALITGLVRKDTQVYLSFLPSPSDDVSQYTLYRYDKDDHSREVVAIFPAGGRSDFFCTDEPAAARLGSTLVYEIEVADSAGNRAASHSGELFYETGFRRPVRNLQAVADRDHRKILLSWAYDLKGVDKFILYRAVEGRQGFLSCATLAGNALGYEDANLHISNTYKYKIKAVMKNGIESVMTKEVIVSY